MTHRCSDCGSDNCVCQVVLGACAHCGGNLASCLCTRQSSFIDLRPKKKKVVLTGKANGVKSGKAKKPKKVRYWSVALAVDATGWVVVEGENAKEAKERALEEFYPSYSNTELNVAYKVVDCKEIEREAYLKRRED